MSGANIQGNNDTGVATEIKFVATSTNEVPKEYREAMIRKLTSELSAYKQKLAQGIGKAETNTRHIQGLEQRIQQELYAKGE